MNFLLYRFRDDTDHFVVTDEVHLRSLPAELCRSSGGLEKVGEFPEVGKSRQAFDEALAKHDIAAQGYYQFDGHNFTLAAERPAI